MFRRKMHKLKILVTTPTAGASVVARIMFVVATVDVAKVESFARVRAAAEGGASTLQRGSCPLSESNDRIHTVMDMKFNFALYFMSTLYLPHVLRITATLGMAE